MSYMMGGRPSSAQVSEKLQARGMLSRVHTFWKRAETGVLSPNRVLI